MAKITEEDLEKVQDPCRNCSLYATGFGKYKIIHCKAKNARLIGSPGSSKYFQLPDCPLRKT
jgi:hypothetical protein